MADNELRVRLILKNGAVLENCRCGYYDKSLWCFLVGISFFDAFQYFSSPDAFETVIFELEDDYRIDRYIYSNIEEITSITQKEDSVNVRLEGEHITKTTEHIDKERDDDGSIYNQDQNEP